MTARVLVSPGMLGADGPVTLSEEAARHLRVLRVSEGEALVLFDGEGHEREAVVSEVSRKAVVVTAGSAARDGVCADAARVTWLQGYPKGDKLDVIVRQATELGVAVIRPVYTARSVPRERDARVSERVERWRRIAEEAARQSGRADVPTVSPPITLEAALEGEAALRIVAWEEATVPVTEVLRDAPEGPTRVLVGPEGGLEAGEVARCEAAGYRAVSLGRRVLRTETMAPALLGVISALRGDLSRGR